MVRYGWLLLVGMLALSACDNLPDYRYKMTIHVSTPKGDKTYSSVRGIHSKYESSMMSSSGQTIRDELQGEAVIMDLPDGRTVYALLSRPDDPDYGTYVTGPALGPHIPRKTNANEGLASVKGAFLDEIVSRRQAMLALKGAYDLPRTVSHNPSHRDDYKPKQMWPTFVMFGDPNRPASVYEVSPESVGVRSITVEITNEPITKGITEKLSWIADYRRVGRNLNGDDSGIVSSNAIQDKFGTGAFLQGN